MKRILWLTTILLFIVAIPGSAQLKDQGFGVGVSGSYLNGMMQGSDKENGGLARAFIRIPLAGSSLLCEFGGGVGRLNGEAVEWPGSPPDIGAYRTEIIPVDLRLLLSLGGASFSPYVYGGIGALHFEVKNPALTYSPPDGKLEGWTGVVPAGLGLAFGLDDNISMELSGGYNLTFSNDLNALITDKKDPYWNGTLGLVWRGESGSADPDKDGLTNDQEKAFGTDKNNADSDGDGLKDGEEVNTYKTQPLKTDTDSDALTDYTEVMTSKTDPLKADTDGDGLKDGEEVNTYKTNPTVADTDGDGLNDGREVTMTKTDPLKRDTDGDGLDDGAEVNRTKSDPLKLDTDNGSVNDGTEVNRGTNPLDASDDIPKKEEIKVEVGKSIALEGVTFATGKAVLTPESETTLEKAYNTLYQNPEIAVEIQGHTDNTGKRTTNMKLSDARANSVKAWLVAKGIDGTRIATKGYGPDKPVAPNTTAAGRAKNRRIEFFRTK